MSGGAFSVVTEPQTGGTGYPLHALGVVGGITYSSAWGGGCLTAEWDLGVGSRFSHQALTPGRKVRIFDGVLEVWRGILSDSDRGVPWRMHARGLASLCAQYAAIDGGGLATGNPNTAVDQAITRGLPVSRLATLPAPFPTSSATTTLSAGSAVADQTVSVTSATGFVAGYQFTVDTGSSIETRTIEKVSGTSVTLSAPLGIIHANGTSVTASGFDNPGSVADLLNLTAEQSGKRWGVFADGFITQPADPTTPDYIVVAVDTPGGRTVDDYATHLYAQFTDSTLGWLNLVAATSNPTSNGTFGRYERIVDLTPMGPITPAAAQQVLAGMLSNVGPRAAFTDSVAVQSGALLSPGGVPVRLSTVRAGRMVRFIGCVPDPAFGELAYTTSVDVVIGQVDYDTVSDTLRLQPVGMKARDLRAVLTAQARPDSATLATSNL